MKWKKYFCEFEIRPVVLQPAVVVVVVVVSLPLVVGKLMQRACVLSAPSNVSIRALVQALVVR